jgi:hypothetical protein
VPKVNVAEKFSRVDDYWRPRVVGALSAAVARVRLWRA